MCICTTDVRIVIMSAKIGEAEFYRGLYEAVINKNVKNLLVLAYSIWHMPISMIDIDYNLLGMYPEEEIGDETYDSIIREKRISKEFKEKFIDERYLINLHRAACPFLLDWGVAKERHRCSFPLRVDGVIYGAMSMVLDPGYVMDDYDDRCYVRIAEAAARILSLGRRSSQISATTKSLAIRFLLSGISISEETVRLYLDRKSDERRHLLVLALSSAVDSPFYAEDIVKRFRAQMSGDYINVIDDRLYVVLNASDDEELMERAYPSLKVVLSKHGDFNCYSCSPFSSLTGLPLYRKEVDFLSTLPGKELFFRDYRSMYLASFISREVQDAVLEEGKFHLLEEYDGKYGTSLTRTLEVYLSSLLDSAETSRELNIHRNTLLNRLNRIEQIASLDLSSTDDVLESIAYFVLKRYRSLTSGTEISQSSR